MSWVMVSASGMLAYRIVRRPAPVIIASRSASRARFVLWVVSSSSITASTSKARVQTTKSAIFWLNLFRVACDLVMSSAPRETWARITCSGSAARSR